MSLVLTPTSVKIKLEGKTQIKDTYTGAFKIILSINRLNTFVLQLSEVNRRPALYKRCLCFLFVLVLQR